MAAWGTGGRGGVIARRLSPMLLAWIPTYLLTVKKFSVMGTGFVAAAPWVGTVARNILGGWLSDRVLDGRRKPGMLLNAYAIAPGANGSGFGSDR
jgi:ACS family glucarate transporter-like MFS transporter